MPHSSREGRVNTGSPGPYYQVHGQAGTDLSEVFGRRKAGGLSRAHHVFPLSGLLPYLGPTHPTQRRRRGMTRITRILAPAAMVLSCVAVAFTQAPPAAGTQGAPPAAGRGAAP